ncbi:MAG: tetratricopeptide repeat protein, partial [Anaerolineales bacterium]
VAPVLNPNTNVESLLNRALEYDPNLGEAYLERARYYFGQGKYDLALEDLEQAEEKLAGSPLVWLLRAQIYWKQGEKEKARVAAQETYQRDLTLLPAYALLGEIYAEQADYVQAVALLERYLTYQPNDIAALLLFGKVQYLAGKYSESEKVLSHLIELAPRRGEAYLYRGLARLEIKKLEAAIDDLDRAGVYFPKSYEVHLGLARAFYMQAKYGNAYQEAERAYGFAEDMVQKAQAVYWRALSLEKLGQIGVAIRDWNALLTTYADVIREEQRKEAQAHLNALRTLTPTPSPKPSPTPPRTPSVTPTP